MSLFIVIGAVLASTCVLQIPFVQGNAADYPFVLFDQSYRSLNEALDANGPVNGVIPESVLDGFTKLLKEHSKGTLFEAYENKTFLQLHCAYQGVIMCESDKKCLLAFFYFQYLVLYHLHRIEMVLWNRSDRIKTDEHSEEEIDQYYEDHAFTVVRLYFLIFGHFGPGKLIIEKLMAIPATATEREELQKVKKAFDQFSNFDYGVSGIRALFQYILSFIRKTPPIIDPRKYVPHMGILNDFFRKVLPGIPTPPLPSSDLHFEFNLMKKIRDLNLLALPLEKYESSLCKMMRTMMPLTFNTDAESIPSVNIETPDANSSSTSTNAN